MGRKRGKINLEKTISKNFFDTSQNNRIIIEPFVQTIENINLCHQNQHSTQATSQSPNNSINQQSKLAKKSVGFHKVVACKLRKLTDSRPKKNKYELSAAAAEAEFKQSEVSSSSNVVVTKLSYCLNEDKDAADNESKR
jgi:hypothetical protein